MTIQKYHLGCPEWGNKDWVGELFDSGAKPKDYLSQYSSVFNTVEGNTTFYGLPKADTVTRWKETADKNFSFCFKFPRQISHENRLQHVEKETTTFLKLLEPLEEKLGPFFLQLPPSFSGNALLQLEKYLAQLPRDFHYAVEVRHLDFFDGGEKENALNQLLSYFQINRVLFDTRGLFDSDKTDPISLKAKKQKPKVPVRFQATASHPFVRFVGDPDIESNKELFSEWAQQATQWISEKRIPYLFIHSADDFYAPKGCRIFHQLLSEKIASVGTLPTWPAEREKEEESTQLSF